jgi:predicted DCC family thiol-disulfide oxidoreductase YuxK
MPATLLYDGLCPFCLRSARRLQAFSGPERLTILPLDAPGAMELHPGLNYSRALTAVQLILENGYLCQGAEAAFNALGLRPGFGFLKILYYLPLFRQIADLIYFFVSKRRRRCESCG